MEECRVWGSGVYYYDVVKGEISKLNHRDTEVHRDASGAETSALLPV